MKRFELRLPDSLHEELKREAEEQGVSLHQLLLVKAAIPLQEGLGRLYGRGRKAKRRGRSWEASTSGDRPIGSSTTGTAKRTESRPRVRREATLRRDAGGRE